MGLREFLPSGYNVPEIYFVGRAVPPRGNMKKFLSVYGRGGVWMMRLLAGVTLLIFLNLLTRGYEYLMWGLFAGYVAGAVCCWSLTNRMGSAFDEKRAYRQISRGPYIRIGSLCLILGGVAEVSERAFFMAIVGYFLFMAMAFGCLVVYHLQKAKGGS